MNRNPSRWFVLLLAAALACNLSAPRQAALPTPTSPASPSPEPFSVAGPATFVSSLGANLKQRVASGEWTREAGLVTTMKFLAGETDLKTINPTGIELHSLAGSDVLRMARAYLKTGKDEATRTELTRLIALALPDPEKLRRYAQPYKGQASAAARHARPVRQTADCRSLWEAGFPEDSATVCFEERSVEAGGQTYRIYYPTSWDAGDPRRAFFEPTAEAVRDSVEAYSHYGAMPSGTIVFALLNDPDIASAQAITGMAGPDGSPATVHRAKRGRLQTGARARTLPLFPVQE
jgi:hypothetical protein